MAYPKITRKISYHYIVIGKDGYRSDHDAGMLDPFTRKGHAERHAKSCDFHTPEFGPHKVVKMVSVTRPADTDGGAV